MSQGLEIQAIAPRANPDLIGHACGGAGDAGGGDHRDGCRTPG